MERFGDNPVAILGISDVGRHAVRFPGIAGAGGFELGEVIGDMGGGHHICTGFGQCFGHGPAKPAPGAGHDHHATFQVIFRHTYFPYAKAVRLIPDASYRVDTCHRNHRPLVRGEGPCILCISPCDQMTLVRLFIPLL